VGDGSRSFGEDQNNVKSRRMNFIEERNSPDSGESRGCSRRVCWKGVPGFGIKRVVTEDKSKVVRRGKPLGRGESKDFQSHGQGRGTTRSE